MIQRLYWFNNQKFLKKYYIDDLVDNNSEVLFVLESPSTREILCNAPASGYTGKKISKNLLNKDCKRGMGELKFNNKIPTDNKSKKIGIMNISQIPMQCKDYSLKDLETIDIKKIKNLSWLRKTIQTSGKITYNYKDDRKSKNQIIYNILSSFAFRLIYYLNNYNKIYKIYLSGNVAQAFFKNLCLR
jgi:hypothetical protein